MISSVSSLSGSLSNFSRAMTAGQRSLADLQAGQDAPLRGIDSVGAAAGSGAGDTAETGPEPAPDLPEAAAELIAARAGVKASVALVRSQDEMLGSLLDIKA